MKTIAFILMLALSGSAFAKKNEAKPLVRTVSVDFLSGTSYSLTLKDDGKFYELVDGEKEGLFSVLKYGNGNLEQKLSYFFTQGKERLIGKLKSQADFDMVKKAISEIPADAELEVASEEDEMLCGVDGVFHTVIYDQKFSDGDLVIEQSAGCSGVAIKGKGEKQSQMLLKLMNKAMQLN